MKILFCSMPGRPIVNHFKYTELSIGSTIIASKLEKLGHEVIFYDLNNTYNTYNLESEKNLLEDIDVLLDLKDKDKLVNTKMWQSCQKMRDFISESDFDIVAFSLEKTYHTINIYAMNLAIMFANFFDKPVYIGGKNLIKHYGIEKIKSLLTKNTGVSGFFLGSNATLFVECVEKTMHTSQSYFWDENEPHHKKIGESDLAVAPKFDPVNVNDLKANIIPLPVIKKYPILKNAVPIMMVPYRFMIGCPKQCSFCETGLDKFFKTKDLEGILEYLKKASDLNINTFRFLNSNLNFTKKFILELTNAIIKANIKISYSDSATLGNLDEEVCSALVDSGCVKLWYGTETLSDRLLIDIKKGVDVQTIYRSLETAHKAGIWNGANLIFNLPNETDEDFDQMVKFIKTIGDNVQTYQCNEFQLMTKSDYYVNHAKYGIKIVKEYFNGQEVAFSDRLNSHEEIRARGDRRTIAIANVLDRVKSSVMSNDLLLFAVHSVVKDKKEKMRIFEDIVSYYKENPENLKDLQVASPLNKADSRLYDEDLKKNSLKAI